MKKRSDGGFSRAIFEGLCYVGKCELDGIVSLDERRRTVVKKLR